jgi:hypothetical protein
MQLHNAPNNASVVAMVCPCGTTELRKTANLGKTAQCCQVQFFSKCISVIEMNKIKIHSFHKYKNNHFIYIKT